MTERSGIHDRKVCRTQGKRRFSSVYFATLAAKETHRELNARRELGVDTYTYRCPACHSWHLTHCKTWNGRPNELVLRAAPVELQRWAFPQ